MQNCLFLAEIVPWFHLMGIYPSLILIALCLPRLPQDADTPVPCLAVPRLVHGCLIAMLT